MIISFTLFHANCLQSYLRKMQIKANTCDRRIIPETTSGTPRVIWRGHFNPSARVSRAGAYKLHVLRAPKMMMIYGRRYRTLAS